MNITIKTDYSMQINETVFKNTKNYNYSFY